MRMPLLLHCHRHQRRHAIPAAVPGYCLCCHQAATAPAKLPPMPTLLQMRIAIGGEGAHQWVSNRVLAGDCGEERESMSSPHTSLLSFLAGGEEGEKNFLDPTQSGLLSKSSRICFLCAGESKKGSASGSPHFSEFCLHHSPDQLSH